MYRACGLTTPHQYYRYLGTSFELKIGQSADQIPKAIRCRSLLPYTHVSNRS